MELKRLCKKLTSLVKGQPQKEDDACCQIFDKKPCLGMKNHFSGGHVDAYLMERGYKASMIRE